MKLQTVLASIVISLAIVMSGCFNNKEGPAVNTGFFKSYEALEIQKSEVMHSLKNYKKIQIAPIQVISGITEDKQTASQKKMYKDIAIYLNHQYEKVITDSGYSVGKKGKGTLSLESSISAVEVHFDDKEWNQLSPIAMGLDTVSFNAYMYESVRLLGEMRLVDSQTGEVVARNLTILKDDKIFITGNDLEFKNLKAGLNTWLTQIKLNLEK